MKKLFRRIRDPKVTRHFDLNNITEKQLSDYGWIPVEELKMITEEPKEKIETEQEALSPDDSDNFSIPEITETTSKKPAAKKPAAKNK